MALFVSRIWLFVRRPCSYRLCWFANFSCKVLDPIRFVLGLGSVLGQKTVQRALAAGQLLLERGKIQCKT